MPNTLNTAHTPQPPYKEARRSVLEQVIADISEKLISLPIGQTDEGIQYGLECLGQFSGVDGCRLIQFVPDSPQAATMHVWHSPLQASADALAALDAFQVTRSTSTQDDTMVRALMNQGFVVVSRLEEIRERSPILQKMYDIGLRSFLVVAVMQGQDRIGYLGLDVVTGAREWSDDDVQLAQIVGRLISGALMRHRAFAQLERQAAIQRLVADVSSRIAAGMPDQLDDNVQYALQRLGEFTKVDIARLFFFSAEEKGSRNTHEWIAPGVQSQQHQLQDLHHETAWWIRHFLTQRVACFHVTNILAPEDSNVKASLEKLGVQTVFGVALLRDGEVVGELGLDTLRAQKNWQADEIGLVQLVAEAVNSALSRKYINDELQHRLAFEALVAEISNRFVSVAPEQTDRAINETLQRVGEFMGADYCRLFQFNGDRCSVANSHEWTAEGVPPRQHLIQHYIFQESDFAWYTYLETHRLIHFTTLEEMPAELELCRQWLFPYGPRSRVSVSLWRDDMMLGELALDALRSQVHFTQENIRLLQVVAEIISNALNRKHTYEQLKHRLAFEHLISHISSQFNAAAPEHVDQVIQDALKQIGEFSGMDGVRLFLVAEDGQSVDNTHEWVSDGGVSRQHLLQDLPMSDSGRQYLYATLLRDGMIHYENVANMPLEYGSLRAAMMAMGVRSFINVLLRRGDAVLGDLGFSSQRATMPVRAENLQLLRVASELMSNLLTRKQAADKLNQLAFALEVERNQLEHRVAERTQELAKLLEVAKTMSLTLDLSAFMSIVLRSLQEVIPFEAGAIWEMTADHQLHELSWHGSAASFLPSRKVWTYDPVQDIHLHELVTRRVPIVIRDVNDNDPLSVAHRQCWLRAAGAVPEFLRTSIYAPLISHDHVKGYLVLHNSIPHFFDEPKVALVQAFASQIAISMENALLHEQKVHAAAMTERSRIARELHDSVSQALFGVVLGARTAIQLAGKTPASDAMAYVLKLSEAALAEMRALIYELRPESLETEGLVSALRRQATALSARHNLQVVLQLDNDEPALPIKTKEALYRIGIEAVQNIIKHASATQIDLIMHTTANDVLLQVKDNGCGFDLATPTPGHYGLIGMRERAENLGAQFFLDSVPGQGTRIQVRIPLAQSAAAS